MKKVNGSELHKNIREVTFQDINQKLMMFDQNGDPPGRYYFLLRGALLFPFPFILEWGGIYPKF
jgi:hypothetical protein